MAAHVIISPDRPNRDTELHIGVYGVPPATDVTLRATERDPGGITWRSSTVFRAGTDGTLDLRRDAPVRGGYRGVDPMGPIWSMEPVDEPGPADPAVLSLVVEVGGVEVATVDIPRRRCPDGLTRTDVTAHGLVGTLFRPAGDAPLPGVLVLGGAEGGMHEEDAALLAAHGFAAMALSYAEAGRPAVLADIPLEYFGRALDHLGEHPGVRPDRLGIVGGSKGGEAALLVGATYPTVRAVVSVVGSGVVTQGIGEPGPFLDILRTPVANWTRDGEPLPYLPYVVTPELEAVVAAGEPVALRLAFEPGLGLEELVPAATIPVERIRGGVLLLSTEDDQGYGRAFHDVAARRLAEHAHPFTWRHIVYPAAGHGIAAPPYGPTTRSLTPGPGVTFRSGGTPEADARARAEAWRETVRFLATELSAGLGVTRAGEHPS